VTFSTVEEISEASGGYAVESPEHEIYIPVVRMGEPGQGHRGAFLDALPRDRTIKFPNVMNVVLAGMLLRRGFHAETEWAPAPYEEYVEVYVRRPLDILARGGS
jgi:hypothetical protein